MNLNFESLKMKSERRIEWYKQFVPYLQGFKIFKAYDRTVPECNEKIQINFEGYQFIVYPCVPSV